MNIRNELGKGHSKSLTVRVIKHIGADQKRFKDLMGIFLEGPYQITQRAAWPLSYCVRNHPELLEKHYNSILSILTRPGIHNSVKRILCGCFSLLKYLLGTRAR